MVLFQWIKQSYIMEQWEKVVFLYPISHWSLYAQFLCAVIHNPRAPSCTCTAPFRSKAGVWVEEYPLPHTQCKYKTDLLLFYFLIMKNTMNLHFIVSRAVCCFNALLKHKIFPQIFHNIWDYSFFRVSKDIFFFQTGLLGAPVVTINCLQWTATANRTTCGDLSALPLEPCHPSGKFIAGLYSVTFHCRNAALLGGSGKLQEQVRGQRNACVSLDGWRVSVSSGVVVEVIGHNFTAGWMVKGLHSNTMYGNLF